MSPSLNCYTEWNNYQNSNFYWTNNSINCEQIEEYNQTHFYKQQHNSETNNRFYQIKNNLSQFYGQENHYDKRSLPNNYTHHPNWVGFFHSLKLFFKYNIFNSLNL